jgi:hypothetical protein
MIPAGETTTSGDHGQKPRGNRVVTVDPIRSVTCEGGGVIVTEARAASPL